MATDPQRLLLVEDNPGDARLVREALRSGPYAPRYEVHHVGQLAEAIDYLATHTVDVILLDLGLPDSHGLDTVRRVVSVAPGTAVVVLTGLDDETLGLEAVKAGAEDYLTKGLATEAVLPRTLRYAMERHEAQTKLRHLNQVLHALRKVSELMFHEREPARLIDQACVALLESGAFVCSWILLTNEAGEITLAASAGFEGPKDPVALWRCGAPPGCLRVVERAEVFCGDSLQQLCAGCPLAEAHLPLTRMAVRLSRNGHCRGMLGVGWPHLPPALGEQQSLLRELAEELSLALDNIDDEQRRRFAEAQALQAASDFRSLAENVPALVARFNPEGRHVYVNPAWARQRSLSPEQHVGKTIAETGVPLPLARTWEERLQRVFASGETLEVEDRLYGPDESRYFQVVLAPERSPEGSVTTVLALASDISHRRRNEELLAARLRLFEYAATATPHDLLQRTLDEVEAVTGSLVGFYHFLGSDQKTLSLEAWSTRTVRDFCAAEGKGSHYPLDQAGVWADCVHQRRPVVHNNYSSLPHKKGLPPGHAEVVRELVVPIFRKERIMAILGVGNKPTCYTEEDVKTVSYLADVAWEIVQRKLLDIQHHELEEQLRQSQKLEAVGRLAGGVAHDFNNMLSVIMGLTQLALDDLGEENPLQADLVEVRKAGERAAGLTRQLLAFSRKQKLELTPLNLGQVVLGFEKMLRCIIGEDIQFVTTLDAEQGYAMADLGQMEQVLMNLAVNARDAMPEGGRLAIETTSVNLDEAGASRHSSLEPGPYVQLKVTDTGCGMDEETQARIFEPFFTTKAQGKGTGLGLSTVYGIVRQLGGAIEVASQVGVGTTFTIYLPLEQTTLSVALKPETAAIRSEGSETILVVEDEAAMLNVAERALRPAGYAVLTASSAGEALLISEKQAGTIHLLLTDVVMPHMNGKELAERLTALRPGLRVLYMSGYADDVLKAQGMLEPGIQLIPKPFNRDALRRRVREVLDAPRSAWLESAESNHF